MHQIEQGRISKEGRCRKVIGARKSIGAHERFWRIIRYFPCILLARARESTEDSEHRHHHSLASCSDTTLVLSAATGRPCCWRRRASYQPDAAAIEERGSDGGAAVAGSTRREHASSNRRLKGWFDLLPYLALPGAVVRLTFNQLSVMHCCPCGWKGEVQSPFHHRLCRPRRFLALAQHASMAATAHRWRWCCGTQQTVRQPRCRRRLRVL